MPDMKKSTAKSGIPLEENPDFQPLFTRAYTFIIMTTNSKNPKVRSSTKYMKSNFITHLKNLFIPHFKNLFIPNLFNLKLK